MALEQIKNMVGALLPPARVRKNPSANTSFSASLSLDDMKGIQSEINRYLLMRGRLPRVNLGIAIVGASGSCSPEELLYLGSTAQRTGARLIGEIGFNIGYSSYAFLSAGPETQVVSFDISKRASLNAAKNLIDNRFPGRHTLIIGDSRKTVPEFKSQASTSFFDLVFIDGSHDYEVVKADILNIKPLCTEETVVIIDDLTPWQSWGKGPTQAWTEAIEEGIIRQYELYKDGEPIDVIEPPGERSWALGRYVF